MVDRVKRAHKEHYRMSKRPKKQARSQGEINRASEWRQRQDGLKACKDRDWPREDEDLIDVVVVDGGVEEGVQVVE